VSNGSISIAVCEVGRESREERMHQHDGLILCDCVKSRIRGEEIPD